MANPATHLTPFDFYIKSFEELNSKMEEHIGYLPSQWDIWSFSAAPHSNGLHITITICYWKDKSKL